MNRHLLALLLATLALGAHAQEPAVEPEPSEPVAAPPEQAEASSSPAETPTEQAESSPEPVETIPVEPVVAEAPPAADEAARLDDMVVTATKREASARELAGTVTALSGDDLADLGAQDMEDIVTAVPGLNLVDERSGALANSVKRITIRGISAGQNQVDTVGVFVDETSFTDPFQPLSSADINPFDVAQVEVLKGPVGTLFGGSALNGAIRYVPQAAALDAWEGQAFAEWRTFKNGGAEPIFGAMVNAPLLGRDDLALRIVGIDRKTAGWVDSVNQSYQAEDVNSVDQESVRGILRWLPLTQLDMSLMYVHQDTLSADFGNSTADRDGRYETTASPQPSPSRVAYDLWQLKGSYAFEWADLVAVASRNEKVLDAVYDQSSQLAQDPAASLLFTDYVANGLSMSQELRLVSASGGDWDWLVGVFNSNYEIDFLGGVTAGEGTLPPVIGTLPLPLPIANANGAVVGYAAYVGDVGEQAAFGELNWRFAPNLQLTAGLRLYRFNYDLVVTFDGPICAATDPTCIVSGLHDDIPLDNKEQGTSPKLSLKWDITDDALVYTTAARGFRFGGINPVSHPEIPLTYGSDSLWSYELGLRTRWFDDTLIADATAFHIDWTNAQFQTITSDGSGFGYTDNVGAVVGRGVEGQFMWLTPLPGVKLAVVAAYADIVTAADYTTGMPPSEMTTPAGTPWPRAPDLTTTTSLDWTHIFGLVELNAGVSHAYLGEARQNFGSNGDVVIFDYATWALQVTAKPIQQGWWPELAVNVNNLTNEQGLNYRYDGLAGQGGLLRSYTAPRNISARLTFSF